MAGIDLSKILGQLGPATVVQGCFKVVVDPASLKAELVLFDEKIGPVPLPEAKFDLDVGSAFHVATQGVSGLVGHIVSKIENKG